VVEEVALSIFLVQEALAVVEMAGEGTQVLQMQQQVQQTLVAAVVGLSMVTQSMVQLEAQVLLL
jgi:hypothetical protein